MSELDSIRRRMFAAAAQATEKVAQDLGGAAARDAPVDTGALRASVDYEPRLTPQGFDIIVAFREPYAEVQETNLEYEHPRGGKARYMADNFNKRAGRYQAVIAAAMKAVIP